MSGSEQLTETDVLTTTTLNIKGSCLDFQKREHVWIFYLKDCRIDAFTSKKFHFERTEPWLILICFRDPISNTSTNGMIDQQIYESERWQSAGGVIDTAPIAFAIQQSSGVRKQVHTITYENIIIHFRETQDTWSIAQYGRAHFPLLHSVTEKTKLSICLNEELKLKEHFTNTLYKKTKRRGR